MKDLNWKDCFEPAPEAFEASVRHALQTKEDKQMKRIIPRSFVIAFALILVLMATALAFGGDCRACGDTRADALRDTRADA